MKNVWTATLIVALTALLLTYSLWDVDIEALGDLLAGASYAYIAPILITLVLYFLLKAWRWALILIPLGRYSVSQVTPAMMIGFAGNNVLPAHLGEIVRSVVFARRYGQPVSAVLVSQVMERILDVVAILLLYLMAVPWIEAAAEVIRLSVWLAGTATVALIVMIYALLARPTTVFKLWRAVSRRLPASFQRRGQSLLENALQALSSVRSPARLVLLIGNSLVQWALMAAIVWLSLRAFDETIGPAATVVVMTATVIAVTLPSTPGYVGAIQAAFVFSLQPFGISDESAFAASVFYLVCQWLPVTATGAVFLLATGLGVSEIRSVARQGDRLL